MGETALRKGERRERGMGARVHVHISLAGEPHQRRERVWGESGGEEAHTWYRATPLLVLCVRCFFSLGEISSRNDLLESKSKDKEERIGQVR